MVEDRISFYESLHTTMQKSGKGPKVRNNSSQLQNDQTGTMKKILRDLIEIKRPQSKLKNASTSKDYASTLPQKSRLPVSKRKTASMRHKTTTTVDDVIGAAQRDDVQPSAEEVDTTEQLQLFKEKLRQLRNKSTSEQQDQKNNNDQDGFDVQTELNNLERIFDACEVTEHDNIEEFNDDALTENKTSWSNLEDCPDASLSNSSVQEEDDFGLNDFDEQSDDNFIVEAYNDDDRYLIFTFLEINHKSYKSDEPAINHEEADIIVHEDDQSVQVIKNLDNDKEEPSERFVNNSPTAEDNDESNSSNSTISTPLDSPTNWDISAANKAANNVDKSKKKRPVIYANVLDTQGNVRIQRVHSVLNLNADRSKLSFIVDEFVKSEERYVAGLRKVIKEYKPYIEQNSPQRLIGMCWYLFGNLEAIYEQSKTFLELLKKGSGYEGIAKAVIISASMFELYPKYSKNKPKSDLYLKEFDTIIKVKQQQMGDRLDLASYLLTPIQRLGKYILMLENIQKELIKLDKPSPSVQHALEIIKRETKKGNDSIAIDSIKGCPFDLSLQGWFLMRESFTILKPKKFEAMVFLFENIVVFTEHTKNLEEFPYLESIRMNDLSIATFENEPLVFHLSDYPKVKRGLGDRFTFVLVAKKPKIKHLWTESIEKRLWEQLENAKSLQKQMHDDEGKRFSKVDLGTVQLQRNAKTRSLTRQSSVFYVQN